MIDGIQIFDLPTDRETLLRNGIDFKSTMSHQTGEVKEDKQTAQFKGLFLAYYGITNKRTKEVIKLSGSINSYANGHNCIDLDYNGLINAINELCRQFSIKPHETVLNGFEIGCNIQLAYEPDMFINDLLAMGKIQPQPYKGKRENYIQFSKSQSTLKIYSKSKQYDLAENLLRYEWRIDKMELAHKFGVFTLTDLMILDKLKALSNELVSTFDELIYYDSTIELNGLKTTDKTILEKGNNPRYWLNSTLHRNTLNENRVKFQSLVREHGKQKFHLIKQSIEAKVNQLLKNNVQNDRLIKALENKNNVQNDILNNVSNCTCIVTNLKKIVSQSNGKYLTPKDIEYYYQNNIEIFNQLIEDFNSTSYKNIDYSHLPLEKRFIEIAHRIRAIDFNSRNNTRNNTRRAIEKLLNEPTLSMFPQLELISKHKKQLAGLV